MSHEGMKGERGIGGNPGGHVGPTGPGGMGMIIDPGHAPQIIPAPVKLQGTKTSEWLALLVSSFVNVAVAVFAGKLAQWGIEIDPELLITAIIGNTIATASYTGGRSYLKSRVLPKQ